MRRFEFPVDREHAKAVNETIAAARRLRVIALAVALLLARGDCVAGTAEHPGRTSLPRSPCSVW